MSDRARIRPTAVGLRAAGMVLAGALALGINAAAAGAESPTTQPTTDTTAPAAPVVASSSSVSLTLFGAPLVVDVTLDPGGNLVGVALNQPGDFTATTVKPNKVVFVDDVKGVSVKVRAKHGGQRIEARASDLADVSGAQQWSGDVFENGQKSVVAFTVGARADGSPDITGVTVTSPFAFTVGATEYNTGDEHDGSVSASAAVKFTDSGQSRTLRIKVALDTKDEHTSAKLSIGLSHINGAQAPAGDPVGTHTWSGMLCDGTAATITYTVLPDGSITGVTTSPQGATVSSGDHGVSVRFTSGERVNIRVRQGDAQLQVGVTDHIRCDAATPTVNTPIDPGAKTGDHNHDGGGDHSQYGSGGHSYGGGDH